MLPWPEGLSEGPAEHAAAEQIVGNAADAAGLVPVRSVMAMLRRPPDYPRGLAVA